MGRAFLIRGGDLYTSEIWSDKRMVVDGNDFPYKRETSMHMRSALIRAGCGIWWEGSYKRGA